MDLIPAPMSVQCFIHVKVNFEKKKSGLHIEKFPFLVWLTRNAIMLYSTLLSSCRSIICIVVVCGRLKTMQNIKRLVVAVTRGGRFQEVPSIVIWLGNLFFWIGRWGEVVGTGGSTVGWENNNGVDFKTVPIPCIFLVLYFSYRNSRAGKFGISFMII